jgi:hypothetical protein
MTKLQLIEKVIKDFDLKSKNRSKEYIYKRYYLYNELRQLEFTLGDIGKMFGDKHYASVLHGIRQHKDLHRFGYEDYKIITKQIDDALYGATLPYTEEFPDLIRDILEVKTFYQFKRIQRHIKLGKYETNSSI